jgi:hypothetical protein
MSDNDYDPLIESSATASRPSAATQASDTFRAAGQQVSETIDTRRELGLPLDTSLLGWCARPPCIRWR